MPINLQRGPTGDTDRRFPNFKLFREISGRFKSSFTRLPSLLLYYLCLWSTQFHRILASNNSTAPSDGSESTFQVLANGTQDLAALVGLFATANVERYAVDYSKGYLSVAAATCSLLGILGDVRAMVKIALGSEWCQNSAFPTAAVRPILGVAHIDRMPKEELITVTYVETTGGDRPDSPAKYHIVKQLRHTEESFLVGSAVRQVSRLEVLTSKPGIIAFFCAVLLVSAGATSFPILLISSRWCWSLVVASFGLFLGLAVSSITWWIVYMLEQCPISINPNQYPRSNPVPQKFAIITNSTKDRITVCDLRAVTGRWETGLRVLTMAMSILICLGYICQYIEVKKAHTIAAARWLGIQAGLALLRIIIWVWDPEFDNYDSWFISAETAGGQELEPVGLPWLFTLLELSLLERKQAADRPVYLHLDGEEIDMSAGYTFGLSQRLISLLSMEKNPNLLHNALNVASTGHLRNDIVDRLLQDSAQAWILKPLVFAKWMELLSGRKFASANSTQFSHDRHKFTAMIANVGPQAMAPSQSRELDPPKRNLHSASEVAIDIEPNPELSSKRSGVDCPKLRGISGQGVVLIPLLIHRDNPNTYSYVIPIGSGPRAKPCSTFIKDIDRWSYGPVTKTYDIDLKFSHAPKIAFAEHSGWDELVSIVKAAAWACGLRQENTENDGLEGRE